MPVSSNFLFSSRFSRAVASDGSFAVTAIGPEFDDYSWSFFANRKTGLVEDGNAPKYLAIAFALVHPRIQVFGIGIEFLPFEELILPKPTAIA